MKDLPQKDATPFNAAQKEAIGHTEGPLLILAGAGSGKTKVLTHRIAHIIEKGAPPERILAVTFTNKAAQEMKKRVAKLLHASRCTLHATSPWIGTFHALGGFILRAESHTANLPRHFSIFDEEDSLSVLKESIKELSLDPKQFQPTRVRALISQKKGELVSHETFHKEAEHYYTRTASRIWELYEEKLKAQRAVDFDDLLLLPVRMFQEYPHILQKYQERWTHIHIDEYQDTNHAQYVLADMLAKKHRNMCVVGDIDQCLIAGTQVTMADGGTRPVETIQPGEKVLSNYGGGDWRPARVTKTFSRSFSGNAVTLITQKGRIITTTPEHIHFAGYRSGLTPQTHFTYLMYKQNTGFRIGTSQMYTKGQKRPMTGFIQRCNQEHADSLWILHTHASQNKAREYEYVLSLKYQIPTLPFVARKGGSKNGYAHDQQAINRIFHSFDTEQAGQKLLDDLHLSKEFPHHRAQSRNSNRRNIIITLCGDRRGKTPMHRISIIGNDADGKKILAALGFSVRTAKQSSKSWRLETARKDYGELLNIAEHIKANFPGSVVIKNARLGGDYTMNAGKKNSLSCLPASSVMPGMALFSEGGTYDIVTSVTYTAVSHTTMHDLNIEKTHNFTANGIVTHNSIYSWRGADFRNILSFEHDWRNARVITLEENYRSTQIILDAANMVIEKNKQRKPKTLFTKKEGGEKILLTPTPTEKEEALHIVRSIERIRQAGTPLKEIAVLMRTNFQSRILEEAFLETHIPYHLTGVKFFNRKEIKDVLAYIKASLNQSDLVSKKRIINMPQRGIGPALTLKILGQAPLKPHEKEKHAAFENVLTMAQNAATTLPPSQAIKTIMRKTGYWDVWDPGTEEGAMRIANLKELVTLATRYDLLPQETRMQSLLEDAALMSEQDNIQEKNEAVHIMTVHAAKGLEFDYVFLVGLEDGLFPHAALAAENEEERNEEERRLFYVALTRARKKVIISFSLVRTIFGEKRINAPSRFLSDIPGHLIETVMDNGSIDYTV